MTIRALITGITGQDGSYLSEARQLVAVNRWVAQEALPIAGSCAQGTVYVLDRTRSHVYSAD